MKACLQRSGAALLFVLLAVAASFATAYNARPKLLVVVVIDQFRADYLERYHEQFAPNGFRLFIEKGAYFTDCNYQYASTRTGPGHATLFTGAYANGHGITGNAWWDPAKKRTVTAGEDDSTRTVGVAGATGYSPRHLLANTLGDELKLATQGRSRVFTTAMKDRAAVLPGGFSADAAYWTDRASGAFVTSTFYMAALPDWVAKFNAEKRTAKYWNLEWKDAAGKLLRTTAPQTGKTGKPLGFYDVVGTTPFANDYQLEFARELVLNEKLGAGPVTDMLVVSLSSYDILGHKVGPDSPEMQAMTIALDRQLADFVAFLGRQVGLANVWIALTSDHGTAPLPAAASKLRLQAGNMDGEQVRAKLNADMAARFAPGRKPEFVRFFEWPLAYLSEDAFTAAKLRQEDAERAVGEAMAQFGMRGYYTRTQLASGDVPATEMGRMYLNSYSPYGGWYVMGIPPPFVIGWATGTDHATPYSHDTHVPLAFYGLAFQPGTYRGHCEPVDMAATLASLLGINAPTHAVGRVLTEALAPVQSFLPAKEGAR